MGVLVHTVSHLPRTISRKKEPDETFGLVEKTLNLQTIMRKETLNPMSLTNQERQLLNNLYFHMELDHLSAGLFLFLKKKEQFDLRAPRLELRNGKPLTPELTESVEQSSKDRYYGEEEDHIAAPIFGAAQDEQQIDFEERMKDHAQRKGNYRRTRRSQRGGRSRRNKYQKEEEFPLPESEEVEDFLNEVREFSEGNFHDPSFLEKEETEETDSLRSWFSFRSHLRDEDDELE